MLRLVVRSDRQPARLELFGDDGGSLVAWVQGDAGHPELRRSHDGLLASVVAGACITVIRLDDGRIVGRTPTGRGIEAVLPLDGTWTLELSGELSPDGGHTGFESELLRFFMHPDQDVGDQRAAIARERVQLAEAARAGMRRRLALRRGRAEVLVHESTVSPAEGGVVLLWPPIAGPDGVLLRHAIDVDDGHEAHASPQRPWLVRSDGTVTRLPFDVGVSPLTALRDRRWLMPGADTVWRDDDDEPLTIVAADGTSEPLRDGGKPVPASRVLRETAPDVVSGFVPVHPNDDVPWNTVAARHDASTNELRLAIEITQDGAEVTVVVAALPLDGHAPARLIERIDPAPGRSTAAAP